MIRKYGSTKFIPDFFPGIIGKLNHGNHLQTISRITTIRR